MQELPQRLNQLRQSCSLTQHFKGRLQLGGGEITLPAPQLAGALVRFGSKLAGRLQHDDSDACQAVDCPYPWPCLGKSLPVLRKYTSPWPRNNCKTIKNARAKGNGCGDRGPVDGCPAVVDTRTTARKHQTGTQAGRTSSTPSVPARPDVSVHRSGLTQCTCSTHG